jgi:hypothetical protein
MDLSNQVIPVSQSSGNAGAGFLNGEAFATWAAKAA